MSDLERLLEVQDLDLAADQLRYRREHLPEAAELAALVGEQAELEGERSQVDAVRGELISRQEAAEAELAATEARAASVDRRLYGGEVSASRDLQALSSEVAQLKARASTLEDTVLELIEQREPLDRRVEDLSADLADKDVSRTEVRGRLEQAAAALDAELVELGGERATAVQAVSEQLVATYERLRARLGGIGVARLVGNHCSGCHLTLSAAELEQVRHLAGGELYTCEQCGRILVP